MSALSELVKLGFSPGLTSTEYSLKLLSEVSESFSKISELRDLTKAYSLIVSRVKAERPTSAQAINLLRDLGAEIVKSVKEKASLNYVRNNVLEFVDRWRNKIQKELSEVSRIASRRISSGESILTHSRSMCIIRTAEYLVSEDKKPVFYVTESRPGMEGLVLAEELWRMSHKVKLIVDSAARFFMKDVDLVLLGAEAVAANGAIVSKIGSSLISLAANEARVRVFVLAPTSKLSIETLFGELVQLPEGDWRRLMSPEVLHTLPENYRARVPLYDVVPPDYIDGIVSEKGLFAPQAISYLIKEVHGGWPLKTTSLENLEKELSKLVGGGVYGDTD